MHLAAEKLQENHLCSALCGKRQAELAIRIAPLGNELLDVSRRKPGWAETEKRVQEPVSVAFCSTI